MIAGNEQRPPLGHVGRVADRQAAEHDVVARRLAPARPEADRANAGLDAMLAGIVALGQPDVERLPVGVGAEGAGRHVVEPLDLPQQPPIDDHLFAAADEPVSLVVRMRRESIGPRLLLPHAALGRRPIGDDVGAGENRPPRRPPPRYTIGSPLAPLRAGCTHSRYVPAWITAVSPGPSVAAALATVFHGASAVPALSSDAPACCWATWYVPASAAGLQINRLAIRRLLVKRP